VLFVVDDESDIYVLVQSCDNSNHDKDSCLFQLWTKEFQYIGSNAEPMLHVVPVASVECQVLVIEDDASIFQQVKREDLKAGVAVVIPCNEYWPSTFLS